MVRSKHLTAHTPYDILSAVFHLTVTETIDDDAPTTPVLLARVCRHWKDVAWETPSLWANLQIDLDKERSPANWDSVRRWLNRSGKQPLFIVVGYSSVDVDPNWASLIHIINQYSDRWCQLAVCLPHILLSLLGGPRATFPLLKNMHLQSREEEDELQTPILLPGASPENLVLNFLPLAIVQAEWHNPTFAEVSGLTVVECVELLRQAPRLVQLEVNYVKYDIPPAASMHVVHHELQCLNFLSPYGSDLGDDFFDAVTLPKLEILQFSAYQPNGLPAGSLVGLVERSGSMIKEMRFPMVQSLNEAEFYWLLGSLPSLRHLECYMLAENACYVSFQNLLRRLVHTSIHSSTDNFLPDLQFFGCLFREPVPWHLLLDLFGPPAEVGQPHRRPLRKVRVEFELVFKERPTLEHLDQEMIDRIDSLEAAGCNLEISYFPRESSGLGRRTPITMSDFMQESKKLLEIYNAMTINDCIAARLPFEILSEIFSICAEDALDYEALPTTPLRLGAVCGYWREVAWRTSAIWATFRIVLYGKPESLINWDFVRDWLKRSKERPLVITIYSCWPTEVAVSPLVDIVNEFSDRWYQLSLHLPYHTISHLARGGTPIYAPRMHYFDLQGHDIPATEGLEPIIIPGTKPKSVDFSLPFSILSVDWSHLTSCNARKQTLDECLCLLRHAPNILDLTLDEMMRPVIEMATTLHVTALCS
ncbi:hypothetical protein CVT26_001806 [Gymnopilus dilepis]|uniref:F-box domain-containing protein n=1 Tax=Gymnopilus dilepis TaxID=231916 RepID=A0A409Y442_9AGAR|nr:hypothetical protein CVT26_001806 [Gymnopilus dilepis]